MNVVIMLILNIVCAFIMGTFIMVPLYYMFKSLKKSINRDYKYCIEFDKDAFELSDMPLIKVKIFDKYRYFLIDSGANNNVLCHKTIAKYPEFKDLEIINNENKFVGANMDEALDSKMSKCDIKVSGEKFDNQIFQLTNLSGVIDIVKEESGIEFIGILGTNFFNKANWVLDFEEKVIWVKNKK